MPKLPRITARKLIAVLLRQGFFVVRQRGSHRILFHEDGRRVVVPMHARDLSMGTLKGILDDIEITVSDFIRML